MAYGIRVYGTGDPSYNVQRRTGTVRYIVVHYTANGKPTTANAAKNNCVYFSGASRNASAHFFVDDSDIWEFADPAKWSAWHVGDGGGRYGITNQNSVGIEVVQDGNEPFSAEEISKLAWLVKRLMAQFSVPAERVVRHYDASRKLCPWYYTPSGKGGDTAWKALHATITGGTNESEVADMASLRDKIVAKALSQRGVRYYSMHTGPKGSGSEGWGCAAYCAWCYNQVLGTNLVGGTFNFWGEVIGAPTYNQGRLYQFEEISASEAQPADLVCYFYPNANIGYSSSCGHIAMYLGNGRVIGAMGKGTPGSPDYLNIGIKETTVNGQSIGGAIRYIRCKRLKGSTATKTTSTTSGTLEVFPVSQTITTLGVNIRDYPSTKTGKVIDKYPAKSKVTIDQVVLNDGYVWGSYIGSSSGKRRYIALGSTDLMA